jgi:hypothetical protein
MGAGDAIRSLFARFQGRELVEEYEPMPQQLTWLECHVPPGGTTAVELQRSDETSSGWGFKIFGSGLGPGRDVRIETVEASEARNHCATYRFDMLVQPRVFAAAGRRSIEVAVLEVLGSAVDSLSECSFCGVARSTIDPFEFQLEPYLDLRADDQSASRTFKVEVERSFTVEAGFKIPGLPAELSLQAGATSACTLSVAHKFQPGMLYQAYRRKAGGPLQTSMWALDR